MKTSQKHLVQGVFDAAAVQWTAMAYDPDETFESFPTGKARINVITKELEAISPHAMLDLGCGSGDITINLQNKGYDVIGVDFAPKMIEECRKRFQIQFPNRQDAKEKFIVGDVESIRFPEKYFDCIYSVGLLEYLERDEAFFENVHRHLSADGLLMVECRNRLFNTMSGNTYSAAEAESGAFGPLIKQLEEIERFSSKPVSSIPGILRDCYETIKNVPLKEESSELIPPVEISFPSDLVRRQFTPTEIETSAKRHGFELSHVVYYHLHLLPPRFERAFPHFYNSFAMAMTDLGDTPLGAYLGSAFLSVLKKS